MKRRRKLVAVNTRLFEENIRDLKQMAADEAVAWQTKLRMVLDKAVRAEVGKTEIR